MLADETNTYTYGLNRINQVSETQTGYFLTDALGSVRQVTSPEDEVLLTREYSPREFCAPERFLRVGYGKTLSSIGDYETDYSYTGEMTDGTGLVNLRARYYDPGIGRFVSKDTFYGYLIYPSTQNRFAYTNNNPSNYTDPTGHGCPIICIPGFNCNGDILWSYPNDSWEALWEMGSTLLCLVRNCTVDINYNVAIANPKRIDIFIVPDLIFPVFPEPINNSTSVEGVVTKSEIGVTGDIGETYLQQFGGISQKGFQTSQGWRYVDQYINGMAYESKVGYVPLTEEISMQVAKDVELLATHQVDSITWVFTRSPVTGLIGPSTPLYELLIQNGIIVLINP